MAVDLSRPAPPTPLGFYPGMAQAEMIVWDRFLRTDANIFDGFIYNQRVGEAPPAPAGTEDNFARMWLEINQSRIDAIGITEDFLTVFEVKVSAGLGAIGQVMGGRILLLIELTDPRPVQMAIVTNGIRPDARTVAAVLAIDTFTV